MGSGLGGGGGCGTVTEEEGRGKAPADRGMACFRKGLISLGAEEGICAEEAGCTEGDIWYLGPRVPGKPPGVRRIWLS